MTGALHRERAIEIPARVTGTTCDGTVIKGLYRKVSTTAPVAVLVHGNSSNMNDALHFNAARALDQAGISSVRFNVFGGGGDQRDLVGCTIADWAADLDAVVAWLKKEHPERPVIAIGHSFGGMAVLLSPQRAFDHAVLWDPSHNRSLANEDRAFRLPGSPHRFETARRSWHAGLGCYLLAAGGQQVLQSEALLASTRRPDCNRLIAGIHQPVLIVAATGGVLLPYQYELFDHARPPKTLVEVTAADHGFLTGETMKKLFVATIDWIGEQIPTLAARERSLG